MRAGSDGDAARALLLAVGECGRLEDHLDRGPGHGMDHRFDIRRNARVIAASQSAKIHHHVDLARTVGDCKQRRLRLHFGSIAAMREADDADSARSAAGERLAGELHPARLHAIKADRPGADDVRAFANLAFGRLGLQDRMIEQVGELGARHGCDLTAPSPAARARAIRSAR